MNPGSAPGADRARLLLVSLALAVVLNWSYRWVESEIFVNLWAEPTLDFRAYAYLLGLLPAFWLPTRVRRPSDVVVVFFYAFVVVPVVHLGYHMLAWPPLRVLGFNTFLVGCFAVTCGVASLRPPAIRAPSLSANLFFGMLAALTLSLALMTAVINNFTIDLSVADVYVRRLAARETVAARSPAAYGMAFLAMSLVPLGVAAGIATRRPAVVLASLIGVASLFSFSGEKTVIVAPLFVAAVGWLAVHKRAGFSTYVIAGLTAGILLCAWAYLGLGNGLPTALFTERLFTANARNATRYFEFFSENDYYWLSIGVLRGIVTTQYSESMAMMLGAIHFGPDSGANMDANMWASAFGDAGYIGVFAAAVITGAVLWLLNGLYRPEHHVTFIGVAGYFGYVLSESSLPVAMVSGGIIPSLMLLFLLAGVRQGRLPGSRPGLVSKLVPNH